MLQAYCWPQSVAPGEPAGLHVSGDTGAFDVEVAREGAEREVVWRSPLVAAPSAAQLRRMQFQELLTSTIFPSKNQEPAIPWPLQPQA